MKKGLKIILILVLVIGVIAIIFSIGYLIEKVRQKEEFVIVQEGENYANKVKENYGNVSYTPNNNSDFEEDIFPKFSEEQIAKRTIDKVTMTLQEATLTKTGATFVITDKNEAPYGYGEDYGIQKKENGIWKNVPLINEFIVPAIGIIPNKEGKITFNVNWSKPYGELEKGTYRFVKNIDYLEEHYEIYAEFTIE